MNPFQKPLVVMYRTIISTCQALGLPTGPVKEYNVVIEEMVKQRMKLYEFEQEKPIYERRKDFFYYLMEAKDPETGKGLSNIEIINEAGLLVGAGFDTSAATVDTCLWYILRNPDQFQKLLDEIRSFPDVEQITKSTAVNLPYLRACIDEVLRLAPPVPSILDRIVLKGGMMIDGNYVAAGTIVNVPVYVIQHDERYFPDAWSFQPERWMSMNDGGKSTEQQLSIQRQAFLAFSAGPRVCIGKNLAYFETSIALARLLYSFDVKLATDVTDGAGDPSLSPQTGRHRSGEYQMTDFFVNFRTGTKIQLRRRS